MASKVGKNIFARSTASPEAEEPAAGDIKKGVSSISKDEISSVSDTPDAPLGSNESMRREKIKTKNGSMGQDDFLE